MIYDFSMHTLNPIICYLYLETLFTVINYKSHLWDCKTNRKINIQSQPIQYLALILIYMEVKTVTKSCNYINMNMSTFKSYCILIRNRISGTSFSTSLNFNILSTMWWTICLPDWIVRIKQDSLWKTNNTMPDMWQVKNIYCHNYSN